MAGSDCTTEQLDLINKFFKGLNRAKARPVSTEVEPGTNEEDEFVTRLNADVAFDIDFRVPQGQAEEWLAGLKAALHAYISNTDRDLANLHAAIDTIAIGPVQNG